MVSDMETSWSKYEYEVLYHPRLVHEAPDTLWRELQSSDTQDCEPIEDEIPMFQSTVAALKQRLMGKGALGISFFAKYFETIHMRTLPHAASHTPVDDTLDHDFNANDWIVEFNDPQVLNNFNVPLSTLEFLEGQKYDYCFQLILASKRKWS